MKMIKISNLFNIKYGTNLELNQLEQCKKSDKNSINFVARSDYNNGITTFVKKIEDIIPNEANTISVAGGGSVLASFYQPEPYYSGRDLYILTPIQKMTSFEMIYYSMCIKSNRYRYNFGRQANKTLKDLLVPSEIPKEFLDIDINKIVNISNKNILEEKIDLNIQKWKYYKLLELFEIKGVKTITASKIKNYNQGIYPYVTRSNINNGISGFYNYKTEKGNVLTISALDGFCTYQPLDFSASMVKKLIPKFKLNKYIALFLNTLLNFEMYRFNYGREAGEDRIKNITLKLPVKSDGTPDFEFMENYIKSLPYSSSL